MKAGIETFLRRFHKKAEHEQALMEAGEAPESRIKNPLQRTAAKLIAGFFALMLAFTVLSRAADGMTIAQVQAETPKSGTITKRAELTGIIRPLEDMDILLPGSLYVTDVKAEAGQKVEEGDVLLDFDLEDVQEQLEEQQNSLAIAEAKLAIAENGAADSAAAAEQSLRQAEEDYAIQQTKTQRSAARAKEDYNSAQAAFTEAKNAYRVIRADTWSSMIETAREKRSAARTARDNAKAAYDAAMNSGISYDEISKAHSLWQTEAAAYTQASNDYDSAVLGTYLEDQPAVAAAQNSVDAAEKAFNQAQRALEDNGQSVSDQMLSASRAVAAAQRNLEQALRTGENSALQSEIEKITQRAQINLLQKNVGALEEILAMDGQLRSPIEGTVQAIANTGKTQDRVAVATLSRNDMGFQFEAKTGSTTAEDLTIEDIGQITYKEDGVSQRGQATVIDIGAADEDGNCLIIAALPEGSYPSGANGTLTISRSGERQNTCLPVSALRSDNDGDYVFVLQEKKSVTGLEYTAKRMDITILDRDSSLASVQSGLARDDKVITSANKPIAEGDRVRLEES